MSSRCFLTGELQMNIPVADAHCDFLYYMANNELDIGSGDPDEPVSVSNMREGGAAMQLFAAWIDMGKHDTPLQQCMTMIDAFHRMIDAHDELVEYTPLFDPSSGKIAAALTIEGGEAIEGRKENLRLFQRLGVRAMTLTWNDKNELACPAMGRRDKGLTRLGIETVHELERLNMALDVAHLGDYGIDMALDETGGPVFSSHTNARFVMEHRRSMCDRHIREIASRGGVIGVNYYSPQLTFSGRAEIADVVKHIGHIAEVGGADCVMLGSDFDGMGRDSYPRGLSTWADVPKLLSALKEAGFTEAEVRKIAYENLARFMARLS